MGLEPTIFRFEVGRLIRWATRPAMYYKLFLRLKFLDGKISGSE